FSADGRYLAVEDDEAIGRLCETATGRTVHEFTRVKAPFAFGPRGWRLALPTSRDGSTLIWDLGRLFRSLPLPAGTRSDTESLWRLLGGHDARAAHGALWRLAVCKNIDSFLARRLQPVRHLPTRRLDALLRDLKNREYTTRSTAEQALADVREA